MKRKAMLVDLDGTLFRRVEGEGARRWFDFHRVREDVINPQVALALKLFREFGYAGVLMSGRPDDEVCKRETTLALADNSVGYEELIMREAGDTRADSVVKLELYRKFVEPFYDADIILDDRNQVVDMWRIVGLQCWQVAPGDF